MFYNLPAARKQHYPFGFLVRPISIPSESETFLDYQLFSAMSAHPQAA